MSPRNSLFKRVAVPLLAVAAATLTTSLCAPVQAVTVSWNKCEADTRPDFIDESVVCHFDGNVTWGEDDFHYNRLGGGDDHLTPSYQNRMLGGGDYYDPSSQNYYYQDAVAGGGTYNCWCVCRGTDYYGAAWQASTGGTTFVSWSGSSH